MSEEKKDADGKMAIPADLKKTKDSSPLYRIIIYILLFYLLHLIVLFLPFVHTENQCVDRNEFDVRGIAIDSSEFYEEEVPNVVTKDTPSAKVIVNNSWSSVISRLDNEVINKLDDCNIDLGSDKALYDNRCTKYGNNNSSNPDFDYCKSNEDDEKVAIDHISSENYFTQEQCKFSKGYGVYLSFFDFCSKDPEKAICKNRLTESDCEGVSPDKRDEGCDYLFIHDCENVKFHLFHDGPYFSLTAKYIYNELELQSNNSGSTKGCTNKSLLVKKPNGVYHIKKNLGVRLSFEDLENKKTDFSPYDNNSGSYNVILSDGFKELSGPGKEISISRIINKIEVFIFGKYFNNQGTITVERGGDEDGVIGLFYKKIISNNTFRNLVLIFLSIYISFFSLSMLLGIMDLKKKEFVSLFVKIILATSFLLSQTAWQLYNDYVVFFFYDVLNFFVGTINGIAINYDGSSFSDVYKYKVDIIFNDIISFNGFWKVMAISFKALAAILDPIVTWILSFLVGGVIGSAKGTADGAVSGAIIGASVGGVGVTTSMISLSPINLVWIVFVAPILIFLLLAFLYVLANIALSYTITILELGFALAIAPLFLLFNLLKITEKMFLKWTLFILVRVFSILFLCLTSFYFIEQARNILYNDIFQKMCLDALDYFFFAFNFFKAERFPQFIDLMRFGIYIFLIHFFSSRVKDIAGYMVSFDGANARKSRDRDENKIDSADYAGGLFKELDISSKKSVLRDMANNLAQPSRPIFSKSLKLASYGVKELGREIYDKKKLGKRIINEHKESTSIGDVIDDARQSLSPEFYNVFKAKENHYKNRGFSKDDAVKNAIKDFKNSKYLKDKYKKKKIYKINEEDKKKEDGKKFNQFLEKKLMNYLKEEGYLDHLKSSPGKSKDEAELEYIAKVFGNNIGDKEGLKQQIVNKTGKDPTKSNTEEINKKIDLNKQMIISIDADISKIREKISLLRDDSGSKELKTLRKKINDLEIKKIDIQNKIKLS